MVFVYDLEARLSICIVFACGRSSPIRRLCDVRPSESKMTITLLSLMGVKMANEADLATRLTPQGFGIKVMTCA